MVHSRFLTLLSLFGLFALTSCIGLRADISLSGDGSGRMRLEYRVSGMAESLGKLDGNERWQTIPAGRADFDRTLARLPGLKLVSFSSKNEGKDLVNRVELEFKDIQSLLPFLEAAGQGASFTGGEKGKNRLFLTLYPGLKGGDPELLSLLKEVSRGYELAFSFTVPGEASLALTNGKGGPQATPNWVRTQAPGKTVSLSADTGDLLSSPEGLGAEFTW